MSTSAADGVGAIAARGTGITLLGQAARAVLQFGATIVFARLLSPSDFGLIAMVAAIIGISEMVRDFGLSSAAIQAKTVSDDERTNLFWLNTALGGACGLAMIALAPLIVALYGEPRLTWIVVAMSSAFLVSGINTQFRADLTRSFRFKELAISDVVGVGGGFAIGIVFAVLGFGYWSIVIQQIATAVLSCVQNAINSAWHPGRPKRHVSIRRFVRFGLGVLGTQSLSYITKNVDNVGVGAVWGAGPLGLYDRAYQLLMTPLNQINAPMTRVALPILSRATSDADFSRYLQKAQLIGCYLTASVFAVSAGLATPLVAVLFGPRWSGVAGIFTALAIGGVFRSIAQVSYWMYLAKARTGAQLRMFLATRPIMVALILCGLPFGPVGVAIGQSVAYLLHWAVSLWRVGVVTGISTRPLFRNGLRTVFLVSLPSGVVAHLGSLLPIAPILQLICGGAFALAYFALLATVLPPVRRDVATVLSFGSRMAGDRAGAAFARLLRGFARDADRKQRLVDSLLTAAPHLRAGRWVVASGSSAFHAGPEGRAAQRDAGARAASPAGLRHRAMALRLFLAGPRAAVIDSRAGGGAVEARRTKDGGLVLFDHAGERVLHVRREPFARHYAERRRELSAYLPNPSWSLDPSGRVLTEALVAGVPAGLLEPAARIALARSVITASAAAVAGRSFGDSGGVLTAAMGWAAATAGGSVLSTTDVTALQERVGRLAAASPLALSHGDLTGQNVLADADGSWAAIDFEDAGPRPYFFDAYSLLMRDRILLGQLRAGAFADELVALHRAAGVTDPVDDDLLVRCTVLLAAQIHADEHGGTFTATLGRLWPNPATIGS